jgi:D-threo-aldose 1-dehydrogenase
VERSPSATLERHAVGRSSVEVSIIGLGAAPLGGLYTASSSAAAAETVQAALAAGINFVDVAPHYGQGLAEQRVGEALAALPHESLILSTKVGRLLEPSAESSAGANWPEALAYATVYDTTEAGIRRSLADSMQRLGGWQPDILLLHDPDRYASGIDLHRVIDESHRTLIALRSEGCVRAIGIGVNAPEAGHIALDVGEWDCFLLAGSYSVLRQHDDGLLDRCERVGVSVLIGGPYMSGALAGGATWRYRPIPPDIAGDIARLKGICLRHGVPMQAAALQFPLRHGAVASIVVGMRSAAEVQENLRYLTSAVPPELWAELACADLIPETGEARV